MLSSGLSPRAPPTARECLSVHTPARAPRVMGRRPGAGTATLSPDQQIGQQGTHILGTVQPAAQRGGAALWSSILAPTRVRAAPAHAGKGGSVLHNETEIKFWRRGLPHPCAAACATAAHAIFALVSAWLRGIPSWLPAQRAPHRALSRQSLFIHSLPTVGNRRRGGAAPGGTERHAAPTTLCHGIHAAAYPRNTHAASRGTLLLVVFTLIFVFSVAGVDGRAARAPMTSAAIDIHHRHFRRHQGAGTWLLWHVLRLYAVIRQSWRH